MSLGTSRSSITALTRDLAARWRETRESWRDAKSDEFQRDYLDGLFAGVERAVTALEQLDTLVARVRKDCE